MNSEQYVNLYTKDKIGFISIYNKKGNSLTKKMLKDFSKGINELSNEKIICIVIESDYNGIFCSGASFDELLSINNFIEAEDFFFWICQYIKFNEKIFENYNIQNRWKSSRWWSRNSLCF